MRFNFFKAFCGTALMTTSAFAFAAGDCCGDLAECCPTHRCPHLQAKRDAAKPSPNDALYSVNLICSQRGEHGFMAPLCQTSCRLTNERTSSIPERNL